MRIKATRDPKKEWLEMKYCVTREHIDWIIKHWPTKWKMLVGKRTTRPVATQSTKHKRQVEAGPSAKTNILADNTRKVAVHTQALESNAVLKRPSMREMVTRMDIQQDAKKGDTSQAGEERAHATMSGVHPSHTKIKTS